MDQWDYQQPVRIRFGNGILKSLPDEIRQMGKARGMLVTSPSFVRCGVTSQLAADCGGLLVDVYGEVSPNPDVRECDACAARMRENACDFVVALGGGSVLDLAKAAATMCLTDDSVTAYMGTGRSLPLAHLPLIAVPTTAGPGSEMTCVSVLSDHARGLKQPLSADGFYPALAVVDPELTHTVPPYLTACTGFDVLCHAVEAYWSRFCQPICDALAVHAARNVLNYLPTAFSAPADAVARERMAEASVIAGMAFTIPKTTSAHACSYPLTNLLGIPHGEACALTIDYFMRLNAGMGCTRPTEMARLLGLKDADEFADRIFAMKKAMGLRTDLRDFNLSDERLETLVQASKHPNLKNNPVNITEEMLRQMYRSFR